MTDPHWPEPAAAPNRPRRALVAAAEVLVVAALGWLALWLWTRGTPVSTPVLDRPDLRLRDFDGPFVAAAVGAATVAGLLVVDAVRQLALAVRTRPGRA
ncbi:hypothetical protein ACOBQX_14695 [Actinokineospora sp. G85]|uniref:hypothetical protein n=1 Tax=Actinokineospora sp. G85 TaxID=3406626 RepID=UPI003C70D4AF